MDRVKRSGEDSSTKENNTRSVQSCPECSGSIVQTQEYGEFACNSCGLVLDEDAIDRGPDWRSFSGEDDDGRHVGAPVTNLLHDDGLSTKIGRKQDGYGQTLSTEKRRQMGRLRTWNERFRTKDSRDRNIRQALGEIRRMASALGLSRSVQETASVIYRRAVDEDLLRGRSIEGMATASLYAAARQHGSLRTLERFATVSRVKKMRFQRTYRYISRELSLGIEPEDPCEYIPQFASDLDLGSESERLAIDILSTMKDRGAHSGKSPAGLAGAALYAAAYLTNQSLTQEAVGEVSNVSEVTIRNRYQELLEIYADTGSGEQE
jgi:transcription initiation factor TFIIB